MTFAILLGKKKYMLFASFLILFLSFGLIVTGVITSYLPLPYLFVFLTLPIAISLFYLMIEFIRDPQRSFSPQFWMGPMMMNWDKLKAAGIDWFMIRWLPARNLLTFFCLILIIINLLYKIL